MRMMRDGLMGKGKADRMPRRIFGLGSMVSSRRVKLDVYSCMTESLSCDA